MRSVSDLKHSLTLNAKVVVYKWKHERVQGVGRRLGRKGERRKGSTPLENFLPKTRQRCRE